MAIDRWTMSLRWQRQIGEKRGLIKQGDQDHHWSVESMKDHHDTQWKKPIHRIINYDSMIIRTCFDPIVYCHRLLRLSWYYWSVMLRVGHPGLHGATVNKDPFTAASNKWERNSICQHSFKTILSYGLADIYHQEKPMCRNPQTGCRLTVDALSHHRNWSIHRASADNWL